MAFYHHHGRSIKYLFALVDAITYNAMFLFTWLACDVQLSTHETRLTFIAFNLAIIPALAFTLPTHARHALMMERVVIATLKGLCVHALFFLAISALMQCGTLKPVILITFYAAAFLSLSVTNTLCRSLLKAYRRKGGNIMQVIIVGNGETAARLASEMTADDGFGYNIHGYFSAHEAPKASMTIKAPHLGSISDLDNYLSTHKIDEVYYSCTDDTPSNIATATLSAERHMARFYFVPPLGHWVTRSFHVFTVGSGVPVLSVHRNPLSNSINRLLKRAFDIVFSLTVLVTLALPVFLPIAIGVRLSSPGPIFFRQRRTGYRGKEFYCIKFRSMRLNSEADTLSATRNDARVTPLGRVLRRLSLDELPQFFNTLVGDMSVVGPRPHMCSMNDRYASILSGYMVRHMIKPGITGWAQVNGLRGNADDLPQIKRRVEHDVWYMDHWSFLLDMKIILRTAYNIVSGHDKNAF